VCDLSIMNDNAFRLVCFREKKGDCLLVVESLDFYGSEMFPYKNDAKLFFDHISR
jgi:hypothetical protein